MNCRFRQDVLKRWICLHPERDWLAWSGSRWVHIQPNGFPWYTAVSNFPTRREAEEYAAGVVEPTEETKKLKPEGE